MLLRLRMAALLLLPAAAGMLWAYYALGPAASVAQAPSVEATKADPEATRTSADTRSAAMSSESPQEREAAARDQHRNVAARLDGVVANEPVDSAWAKQAKRRIASAFDRGDITDGVLADVRCASSICRVTVAPLKGVSPQEVVSDVIHAGGPFSTGGHYSFDAESGHMRFYVRREGSASLGARDEDLES